MTNSNKKRKNSSRTSEPTEPTTQPQSNFVTPRKRQKPFTSQDAISNSGRPPLSTASRTPRVSRSGTSGAYSNRFSTTQQLSTERHDEASIHYEQRLDKEQDFILKLAQPLDTERQIIAEEIIEKAALFMESYLNKASSSLGKPADGMDVADERRPDSPMQQPSTPTDSGTSTQRAERTIDNSLLLNEKLKAAKEWISWQSIGNEKVMYGPIGAFIEYVALMVQERLTSLTGPSSSNVLGCRLVLPSMKSDYKPPDADDSMRIDMGLTRAKINDPIDAYRGQVSYYEVLAVLEAKRKGDDNGFRDAFLQLDIYTRQLYQQQHNLRVAWGVTVSGKHVRVCHFGPDRAKSSSLMDVSIPEGRRAFVEVLVNWSLCEESQLGRDPTMKYLDDLKCWKIACPGEAGCMGEGAVVKDYYFTTVSCQADRLFGRHTRCFLATDARPTAVISADNPLKPTVVIKDSWALSKRQASEDTRDEVKSLNKVRDGLLEKAAELDIIIPEIVAGGRVSFLRNGDWVEDNTDTVCGLGEVDDPSFRAHRRIVMRPIGEPLRSTKSVAEFVTVVCDAMRCHSAFVELCNILQRDISDNNTLVFRGDDGIARGMLIDLDCAIDLGQGEQDIRKEMTGTDPYTSINNLSTTDVERTSLDDWESMLCLICWFATYGTISGNRNEDPNLAKFPIALWRQGSTADMLTAKQSAFYDYESFRDLVVNNFKPEGDKGDESNLLENLAFELHDCLFQNRHLSPDCRGTRLKIKYDERNPTDSGALLGWRARKTQRSESLPMVNPFKERAKIWKDISKQLLEIANDYFAEAMDLQKKAIEAKSNAAIDNIPQ
ncbi:hypothetical protein H4R27_000693 [Coemansia aciculifera]|nr:hypothetical protein H4R27_000693 [Coemansia aciculifera]